MKKVIAFAFLLLGAPMVYSQAIDEYGARLEVSSEIDYSSVDRSYLNVPNTEDRRHGGVGLLRFPVWHPDGKGIVCATNNLLLLVPAEGGTPRALFESFYIHTQDSTRYILNENIFSILGFSPDGLKLYFTRQIIDPSTGAVITIGKGGESINGGTFVLDCLNMDTGGVETVAKNIYLYGALSKSGRYLAYFDQIKMVTIVKDLTADEEWERPISLDYSRCCFSGDERYLLAALNDESALTQLFRFPIRGGDPEPVSAPLGSEAGYIRAVPDISSDGEWMLYTDEGKVGHPHTWTYPDGNNGSASNHVDLNLYAYNLKTGGIFNILPISSLIECTQGQFSPDGKRFVYRRVDMTSSTDPTRIYIANFSPNKTEIDGPLGIADAAPSDFALAGNYPNPFNPSTHIAFTLPSAGKAQLTIYDVTGRTVRNLTSPVLSAGWHEMVWDGRDNAGAPVSSGTYIARLKMGAFTDAHRMMLVK